jgi:hypothetical protein
MMHCMALVMGFVRDGIHDLGVVCADISFSPGGLLRSKCWEFRHGLSSYFLVYSSVLSPGYILLSSMTMLLVLFFLLYTFEMNNANKPFFYEQHFILCFGVKVLYQALHYWHTLLNAHSFLPILPNVVTFNSSLHKPRANIQT